MALRPGERRRPEWSVLAEAESGTRLYAGTAELTIRSGDAMRYKDNLEAPVPALYVVLGRCHESPTGWRLLLVTADPTEAHRHLECPHTLVEALPMPASVRDWLAPFVARNDERTPPEQEASAEGDHHPVPPGDARRGGGGLLDRWSRRKRLATEAAPEPPLPAPGPQADAASLPPLESLGPDSDYAAFMRKGVPKVVRLAALRRAWTAKPAIAGHKPLVDYDWNVNLPGYGRLRPSDDPVRMATALFRHLRPCEDEPRPPDEPAASPPDDPAPAREAPGTAEPAAGPAGATGGRASDVG